MASVLKPVDDTRMFEKIGATLADGGEFEVSIIGYPSNGAPTHPGIKFYALSDFKRISLKRLLAPWVIFKKINQVKPELIIINTPELLLIAILNRIFFGRKIVYDVRENYYRNIRFTQAFPPFVRLVVAPLVRLAELLASPLVHQFLLAEKGYSLELGFAKPNTILQNKLPKTIALKYLTKKSGGYSKLIFSGTLAKSTGVFEAITLCKKLHKIDSSYSLTIVGYCALSDTLAEIKNEIKDAAFITLIGGGSLVPHNKILEEISNSDMGIIIYPLNPSTHSSIPTKLFEYIALQLPVLIRHNSESHQLVENCNAGIILYDAPDYGSLSTEVKNHRLTPVVPDSVYWESEAQNLIGALKLI